MKEKTEKKMSLEEIKAAIDPLTSRERFEIFSYILVKQVEWAEEHGGDEDDPPGASAAVT